MKLETFQYKKEGGWSITNFPNLDSKNTIIFVFSSPHFLSDPSPFVQLKKHYPRSIMIGCSDAGEILGSHAENKINVSVCDDSISVAIVMFEKTNIKMAAVPINDAEESYVVGKQLVSLLLNKDIKSIFVLSEGLKVNGSDLVHGLNEINKNDQLVITGGLAGDGDQFKQTWAVINGEIKTNHVVGVGFYGDNIKIGHGSRGGWDIFGPERRITYSNKNILYELDNKPALQLYKEYLGARAADLPATGLLFPLSIRKDSSDPKQLVRTILGINEENQSLIFAGDVPKGYFAQLMHANFDRLITSAGESASSISGLDRIKEYPLLAIAISCVGRRLLLGTRSDEEVESVLRTLPKQTKLVGFYSYGELSPFASGKCDLHNQTMTLTTFYEK